MAHRVNKPTAGSSSALTLGVKEFFATGLYSDLTISCGGQEEFKVHKVIVHPKSSVFRALLSGRFKEAAWNRGTIPLDDDPATLRVLLKYFYSFVYDDSPRPSTESLSAFAVRVYAIADKYDVKPLQDLAAQRLENVCYAASDHDVDDYIAAVQAIDELTNPRDVTLWGIIIPKTISNIGYLLSNTKAKEVILGTETLNVALLKHLGRVHPAGCAVGGDGPLGGEAEEDSEDDEDGGSGHVRFSTNGLYLGGGRRLGSG